MILDPKEFEEVRLIQLEILLEFDRLCRENNIHYNLYFGTMLGAVRHEGFIPWDDDIDVAMTRDNYNKFLSLSKKLIKEEYFVQNYESDPNFFRPFTRIRKNDTVYKQRHYKDLDIHHGIFMDVFPFDVVYKNKNKEIIRYKYLHYLRRLNVIKNFGVDNDAAFLKKEVQKLIARSIPSLKFNRYITKIMSKRNNQDTGYLNHLGDGTELIKFDRNLIKEEDFLDSILTKFEGHKFPIPKNYDKYLSRIYGDYMRMPPLEEQIPHHQIIEIKL